MAIPDKIKQKLSDQVWLRPSTAGLEDVFLKLGLSKADPFCEFYSNFWGPFRSDKIGHELLDLVEQDESILTNTDKLRLDFGLHERYLVVTSLHGLSVLVYDVVSGQIFDVDFEGGDELLANGVLESRWKSWWEFVEEYFS